MKSVLLLASPRLRSEISCRKLRSKLDSWREEATTMEDRGYLHLAEVLLTGADTRPLPDDEKVDQLSA